MEARSKYHLHQILPGGSDGCAITVSVLWWHPDATHCQFVFDRHLYKSLWVGEAVPAPPLLLLLSCRDCAFHSSAIKADGCLQTPRQRDRWAPLPTHSYPHNYKQALADLAYFLVWNQSKKSSTMAFILASVRKLMQTETYANLSCPCLLAETQLRACHKAELLPNSLVLHLFLNLNCPPTAFVPVLVRQGNINDFNSICMKQHIACVRLVITYILWYHKCLEEPPGSMCLGRREGKMVGNVKEKIIWEHYDFRANWNWHWY